MTGGGIETRETRELEANPCCEQRECEGCPDWFPVDELDEEGLCRGCAAAAVEAEANDRYWRSMRW